MALFIVKKANGEIILVDPAGSLEWLYDETITILGAMQKKIGIGTVIQNRKIYEINNSYCIAESNVPGFEEYVVWNIDHDGCGVHTGRYFAERESAEWEYASLAFPWFQDNISINLDDDEEPAIFIPEAEDMEGCRTCGWRI